MLPSHITAQKQEDSTDQLKFKCGDECLGHTQPSVHKHIQAETHMHGGSPTHEFNIKVSRSHSTDKVIKPVFQTRENT